MAGNGNPYAVLTASRLRLLHEFHDQAAASVLMVGGRPPWIEQRDELTPLLEANLLREEAGRYQPAFLVVTADEVRHVDRHARSVGHRLALRVVEHWAEISATFRQSDVSRQSSLDELAFLLVGDLVLDVGLLDALARESTLMPAAPLRPSPDLREARYYVWMIEGEHNHLGRYGQRLSPLPWDGWSLITFGEYMLGEAPNAARAELEAAAKATAAGPAQTPEELALSLRVPLVGQSDAEQWWRLARTISRDLIAVYHEQRQSFHDLYMSLGASAYLDHGFGEFFCWYDHVAYAHAIDALAKAGALSIPTQRFSAAVSREVSQAGNF